MFIAAKIPPEHFPEGEMFVHQCVFGGNMSLRWSEENFWIVVPCYKHVTPPE
jgi:hypothetical protein